MNLIESAKQNLQSFETTTSSVMDGSYCEEFTALLLQVKCKNIHMEADIATALYPEQIRPYLKLYAMRITRCLNRIREMQSYADERQLERFDIVYGKLFRLRRFIRELLVEVS